MTAVRQKERERKAEAEKKKKLEQQQQQQKKKSNFGFLRRFQKAFKSTKEDERTTAATSANMNNVPHQPAALHKVLYLCVFYNKRVLHCHESISITVFFPQTSADI